MADKHEIKEARGTLERKRGGEHGKLHHIRVHPHKGGHLVTHHGHNPEPYGPEHEEKPMATHVFGKEDGEKLMAHLKKHAKITEPEGEAEPGGDNEVEELEEEG